MRLKSRNKVLIGIDDDNNIIYLEDVFGKTISKVPLGQNLNIKPKARLSPYGKMQRKIRLIM